MTHASERAPPTHKMAVWPITIFPLTFKARNSADRVLDTDILIKSYVLSKQKQGLSLKLLVSEQAFPHNSMQLAEWSRAQPQ